MEPLKQCPFPHKIEVAPPRLACVGGWWRVECRSCNVQGPACADDDVTIAAWNRRTVPREVADRIAELAAKHVPEDDEHFAVDDYAGGNIDDAYANGAEAGEVSLARELAKALGFPGAKVPT